MLESLSNELSLFIRLAQIHLSFVGWMIAGLWIFNILNWATGSYLNLFGIIPRHPLGIIGILISPLLHQNFNHLFFNTIPLFALSLFVLTFGTSTFYLVTFLILILSGTSLAVEPFTLEPAL